MTITVKYGKKQEIVEVVRKVNAGLRPTHNHDGRFQKMWAVGADGSIYTTRSRGGHYRPVGAADVPPAILKASVI